MTSEANIFSSSESSDPVERARAALRAVRQYQQDWQEHGIDRVHKYFDDVEGNWLEEFDVSYADCLTEKASRVPLSDIYEKLKSLGLSNSFIENVAFPSWWKSEFGNDENAISRLLDSLRRRLYLEIGFLQNSPELLLEFSPIPIKKFKLQKRQENPELFGYLARSVASAVVSTVDSPYISIPSDPLFIREAIMQGGVCVSLNSLLEFCWSFGLPVIHFDISSLFGKGSSGPSKSDGLVMMAENRPVVVIGSSRKHSAWLLFILAHELGHIAYGHLKEGILSDESFKDGVNDDEEDVANQFASRLLFGDMVPQWPQNLNKQRLLKRVERLSENHNLDPGALILNYGWQTGNWGCAVGALSSLETNTNAPAQINAYYQSHLISIDDESRDYLQKVNVLVS